MVDPFTLLIACAFAATFMFATGLQLGFMFGEKVERARKANAGGGSK